MGAYPLCDGLGSSLIGPVYEVIVFLGYGVPYLQFVDIKQTESELLIDFIIILKDLYY